MAAHRHMSVFRPLCGWCGEYGWPVMVYLNEPLDHAYPGKTADSVRHGEILTEGFTGVTFIYGHLGGGCVSTSSGRS